MHRLPVVLLLAIVVLLHGGQVGMDGHPQSAASARPGQGTMVDAAERLNIASFSFSEELDVLYNHEYARLNDVCQSAANQRECRARKLAPVSREVAGVRRLPVQRGPVVGRVHAVLNIHPDFDLGYALELERSEQPARRVVWMNSVGDWGYGIEVPGVRVRGNWIQLFGAPFSGDSWVDGTVPSFSAHVTPLEGAVVTLPPLPAVFPGGGKRPITAGSYFVQRVINGQVVFRGEVASDVPCGDDVKPPAVLPPSLRAAARDLFDDQSRPLFSITYGRGC